MEIQVILQQLFLFDPVQTGDQVVVYFHQSPGTSKGVRSMKFHRLLHGQNVPEDAQVGLAGIIEIAPFLHLNLGGGRCSQVVKESRGDDAVETWLVEEFDGPVVDNRQVGKNTSFRLVLKDVSQFAKWVQTDFTVWNLAQDGDDGLAVREAEPVGDPALTQLEHAPDGPVAVVIILSEEGPIGGEEHPEQGRGETGQFDPGGNAAEAAEQMELSRGKTSNGFDDFSGEGGAPGQERLTLADLGQSLLHQVTGLAGVGVILAIQPVQAALPVAQTFFDAGAGGGDLPGFFLQIPQIQGAPMNVKAQVAG